MKPMDLIYLSTSENTDLCPLLVGHYVCPALNSYGPHVRNYYILHLIVSGKGTLFNDRGEHCISRGQMFLIREGEVTTYIADKDDPWEYVWIGFSGNRAKLFDNSPDVFEIPANIDTKLYEYIAKDEKSHDIYLSILYEIIYHLFTNAGNDPQDERIRSVHRYIKYNYMDNITINGISSYFNLERSHLYRLFKQRYGIGPKEYLTRIRLEKARWLLPRGYSVSEVAYMVGYSDAFSFSKAYKKRFGISPSHDVIDL